MPDPSDNQEGILQVQYKVIRPFDYNGRHLKVGDTFIPAGTKFDGLILQQGRLVKRIETAVQKAEAARRESPLGSAAGKKGASRVSQT